MKSSDTATDYTATDYEKLKTEHARYKKALESICKGYTPSSEVWRCVNGALNPPPPPTITEAEICAALRELNRKGLGCNHSITIFSDGSASVGERTFCNLHEALDFLNGASYE